MPVDRTPGLNDRLGTMRLGYQLLRSLPKPNYAFFIDIDPEVAFGRRPDLPQLSDYAERLGCIAFSAASGGWSRLMDDSSRRFTLPSREACLKLSKTIDGSLIGALTLEVRSVATKVFRRDARYL